MNNELAASEKEKLYFPKEISKRLNKITRRRISSRSLKCGSCICKAENICRLSQESLEFSSKNLVKSQINEEAHRIVEHSNVER